MPKDTEQAHLNRLLKHLRGGTSGKLEELGVDLLASLLDLPIVTANAGFQFGGDGGTARSEDRHVRMEAKRYGARTKLSDRELLGEIDHALRQNDRLEVWILIATVEVPETTRDTLRHKAESSGLPIEIIDWTKASSSIPTLAALCAEAADIVEHHYGPAAGRAAQALSNRSAVTRERLRRDLAAWAIGYESLCVLAEQRLQSIWRDVNESLAHLGQNVAGGAESTLIPRRVVSQQLRQWQQDPDRPCVLFGQEGVGKTWAAMHWIIEECRELPLTLMLPASNWAALSAIDEMSVLSFLARSLQLLVGKRTLDYWQHRLRLMLKHTAPVLLVIIDGLNQHPLFDWSHLLHVLQAGVFAGRLRVVMTTQTHYFENDLRGLKHHLRLPVLIGVEPYDIAPGGELDQMLAQHRLAQSDVAQTLIPLARIPRLFPLVVKYRADAHVRGDATVYRLLLAYGRDELSMRCQRAFSDLEWNDLLHSLAKQYLLQLQSGQPASTAVSLRELTSFASYPHSNAEENRRRLHEIIDSRWAEPAAGSSGFRIKQETMVLALGLLLLDHLGNAAPSDRRLQLTKWMDPIGATSMAADILAAALSVVTMSSDTADAQTVDALVTQLLQSQNMSQAHRSDVKALAPVLTSALLSCIERSQSSAFATARESAIESLRAIPPTNVAARAKIIGQLARWVAHVTCPDPTRSLEEDQGAAYEAKRLKAKIGVSTPGSVELLGIQLRIHAPEPLDLTELVPRLLQGSALQPAAPVLFAAAVAVAVTTQTAPAWDGLRWLVLLNQIDRDATVQQLSRMAEQALVAPQAPGVDPELNQVIAIRLLSLCGSEQAARRSMEIPLPSARAAATGRYAEYLADPAQSPYTLERKHVPQVLTDDRVPAQMRLRKVKHCLADPTLRVPRDVIEDLEAQLQALDVRRLTLQRSRTREDILLGDLLLSAARLSPTALASMTQRRLLQLPERADESRYSAAMRAVEHLLLVGPEEARAAGELRKRISQQPHQEESLVQTSLLNLELLHLSALEQLDALVDSDAFLTLTLMPFLHPIEERDLRSFFDRWGADNEKALRMVLHNLAHNKIVLSTSLLAQLIARTIDRPSDLRNLTFIAFANTCPREFGAALLERGWRCQRDQSHFEQDGGSLSVLAASVDHPLEPLRHVVAPWRLLREARERGGAENAKLAASAISEAISSLPAEGIRNTEITIEAGDPFNRASFEAIPSLEEDALSRFNRLSDPDAQHQQWQQAFDRGVAYLARRRAAGAMLFARNIPVADVRTLLVHCTAEVDAWLDGVEDRTDALGRRIESAGGFYCALCEALLEVDPHRGVQLWFAIEQSLTVKFVGLAEVNDLIHLAFRAPDSEPVDHLRRELFSLRRNPTDQDYLDKVICALVNDRGGWLKAQIERDERSGEDWRRKRAMMLRGLSEFRAVNELRWYDGPDDEPWSKVRATADRWRQQASLAQHWWQAFFDAPTPELAYAAWIVFLSSADRRAWIWVSSALNNGFAGAPLARLKWLHTTSNRPQLNRAMREKESFLGRMNSTLMNWNPPHESLDLSPLQE